MSLSPNGDLIARVIDGAVVLSNLTGGNERTVVADSAWGNAPRWSPDGKHIAYIRNGRIWIHEVETGSEYEFAPHEARQCSPRWSPDGSRLAFASDRVSEGAVFLADRDGSNLVQVTDALQWDQSLQWSPDGREMLMYRNGETYVIVNVATKEARTFGSYRSVHWLP